MHSTTSLSQVNVESNFAFKIISWLKSILVRRYLLQVYQDSALRELWPTVCGMIIQPCVIVTDNPT